MCPHSTANESWWSRAHCLRHALAWSWLSAPLAMSLAALIPLSVAGTVAVMVLAVITTTFALASHPSYEQWLAADDARRLRAHASERRESRLGAADIPRVLLLELTGLVEATRERDVDAAERHDLDGLLDHYVELALSLHQCRLVLAANPREPIATTLATLGGSGGATCVRTRLLERRLGAYDECARIADRLEVEVEALVELVRLHAQRAAMPVAPPELKEIERALADLEQEDAALGEVACLEAA
jgi:hypothetical protein